MMKICYSCMTKLADGASTCPHCGYQEGTNPKEPFFLVPGTTLQQRYVVGKVLGNGGFGITYIGYDGLLDRVVAIKEYFPNGLVSRNQGTKMISVYSGSAQDQYSSGLNSFIDEARRLAQFSKIPVIVDIYDCFMENGTGYIVMEFLKGHTIRDMLAGNKRMPYSQAEAMILEVLDGLQIVHRAGLIHRDIAPDNLFITEDGTLRLIDFGAARYATMNEQKSISVMLKPGYAPVEQYSSHGKQGPWTDIYAVGATFYRMITGTRPGDSMDRIVEDHLMWPSQLGVQIPRQKEEALMRALAPRADQRIQNAEEFKNILKSSSGMDSSDDYTQPLSGPAVTMQQEYYTSNSGQQPNHTGRGYTIPTDYQPDNYQTGRQTGPNGYQTGRPTGPSGGYQTGRPTGPSGGYQTGRPTGPGGAYPPGYQSGNGRYREGYDDNGNRTGGYYTESRSGGGNKSNHTLTIVLIILAVLLTGAIVGMGAFMVVNNKKDSETETVSAPKEPETEKKKTEEEATLDPVSEEPAEEPTEKPTEKPEVETEPQEDRGLYADAAHIESYKGSYTPASDYWVTMTKNTSEQISRDLSPKSIIYVDYAVEDNGSVYAHTNYYGVECWAAMNDLVKISDGNETIGQGSSCFVNSYNQDGSELYQDPDRNSSILNRIPFGTTVSPAEYSEGFAKISYNGQTGWVDMNGLASPRTDYRYLIETSDENGALLRPTPSTSEKELGYIRTGTVISVNMINNGWGVISLNQTEYWICMNSLKPTGNPTGSLDASTVKLYDLVDNALLDPSSYVMPETRDTYLSMADIENLTPRELSFARNEIYARHNRKFRSDELRGFFESRSWYQGIYDEIGTGEFTACERANSELLYNREKAIFPSGYIPF